MWRFEGQLHSLRLHYTAEMQRECTMNSVHLKRCPWDWPLWIRISLQRQISCCVVFRHYLILCLFEFYSAYLCLWLHYPDFQSFFLICSPTCLSFISVLVLEERLSFCWTVTAPNPPAERTTQSHWNSEGSHKGSSFVSELQTFPADTKTDVNLILSNVTGAKVRWASRFLIFCTSSVYWSVLKLKLLKTETLSHK